MVKIISIILFLITISIFSYTIPYYGMQSIYKTSTNKKTYNRINFKLDNESKTIDSSTLKSEDLLLYTLSNLFLGEKTFSSFAKKHKIKVSDSYLELFDGTPVVVYGTKEKNNEIPQIWLNKETAVPIKVVFSFNNELVTLLFLEYNNQKYGYSFPSKVKIISEKLTTTFSIFF